MIGWLAILVMFVLAPLNEPSFHWLPLVCPERLMAMMALVPFTPLMSTVSPGILRVNSARVVALG